LRFQVCPYSHKFFCFFYFWSTFTIEIWFKILKFVATFLNPFPSSTCFTFTTRTWLYFFIPNPTFTYPFPCSTCFTFTSTVGSCNSSFTCSTLTLKLEGLFYFDLSRITLRMKSFKNFCSSSFTLLGREDIFWEFKCFRKEVEMRKGLCWNLIWVLGLGGKCKLHKVAMCAPLGSSLITMMWDPKAIFG